MSGRDDAIIIGAGIIASCASRDAGVSVFSRNRGVNPDSGFTALDYGVGA